MISSGKKMKLVVWDQYGSKEDDWQYWLITFVPGMKCGHLMAKPTTTWMREQEGVFEDSKIENDTVTVYRWHP